MASENDPAGSVEMIAEIIGKAARAWNESPDQVPSLAEGIGIIGHALEDIASAIRDLAEVVEEHGKITA